MVTEADVRELALSFPETSERPTYGTPGFRVKKKLFSRLRDDPHALVIWLEGEDEKEGLIESEPEKFFTIPHYDGYAVVLVHLEAIGRDELQDLLEESWLLNAPKRLAESFRTEHPDQSG